MPITVMFSEVMQRLSKVPSFDICVAPRLKDALKVINGKVVHYLGETALFTVLYNNRNCGLCDINGTISSEDCFLVVPVILGG